jgi:peptidyl-dipeptidase Dcp
MSRFDSIFKLPFGQIMVFIAMICGSQLSFAQQEENSMKNESVLLRPWSGPFGGVPPWDQVKPEEFIPSFEKAVQDHAAEINSIASQTAEPTFENTMVAMEKAGEPLGRLQNIFYVHAGNLNLGEIPEIEKVVAPLLAKHFDSITQNTKLFARIETIYNSPAKEGLTPAQQRLLETKYKDFVRSGAKLAADKKTRLSEINQRLATLFSEFNQKILADEQSVIEVTDPAELTGLPESIAGSFADAAKAQEKGEKETNQGGRWLIANTRSAVEPVLTYADSRALREKVWRAFVTRGDNNDANDTKALITEILKLRAERAMLLGYPTHAHWRLEPAMAKTPENAMALLMEVWPKAVARVKEEVADMQALADAEKAGVKIEPWDYRYYAEKVRKAKYDLDFNEVRPYLQLDKLVEGMFWSANQLFGLSFNELKDVPVFHDDVRVWAVRRGNQPIGLFYFDPFARKGKRSGAWMTDYRAQQNIDQPILPLISNNCNYLKPGDGGPVLISWDDAVTLFHEFGHGLHGLLSNVQYPSQSGTSVSRDYVEFPSQLFEHWLTTPEVMNQFALHCETGKPIPQELIDKIEKAAKFNQGFSTVEYLSSALIDMHLHLAGDIEIDPASFEKETLANLGMPKEMVMRHRTPQFSHVFSSDGYSAGYYSYIWADALTADAAEAFDELGSYFDKQAAERMLNYVFSVGDTIDPAEGFRQFRGRDVDTNALLRKRGFPVGSK